VIVVVSLSQFFSTFSLEWHEFSGIPSLQLRIVDNALAARQLGASNGQFV
jgi:hypothetical protein